MFTCSAFQKLINLIIASRRSRYFLNESDKSQNWRWSGAGWADTDAILAAARRTIIPAR
jgi:hypothetical protein